ncbi:zinc finger domain-containing protein [Fusarium circinatum]|uniref:Zinc finger domain-containing protein n=1 Tax=Fusarium circinatum TaxID=48490 RepID=A0A8H5X285_FUSCI|nr:zinc finger domain-containing protein [Fusarium circinatum]
MSEPREINDLPTQHPEDIAATPTTQAEAKDGDNAITKPDPSLCGVCEVNPPKYKCPRCRLPYCSVACNKIHRENHPPDPEPAPAAPQSALSESQATSLPQRPDPSNPFQALESSEKLRLLFRKYPGLPDQLRKIDAATLPPPEAKSAIPASLLKGLPPKQEAWNHDIGIQNGKEALRKARRADGEQGDAIREYSELILHLMNTENARTDVDNIIRQKMAREDTKLIERLMAQEKR